VSWDHVWAIASVDLRRLFKSKDYWIPLTVLGGLFFVVIPFIMLGAVGTIANTPFGEQITSIVGNLPDSITRSGPVDSPTAQAAYMLAVYMLAPIAIIVPLTISAAVASNAIVGERERGTGEFLAHSPLTTHEIYYGKLIASLVPGYLATIIGFSLYSLVVNITVGPEMGGWFFPTSGWLFLILWVIPPFIAVAISIVLRMSARMRSAAAAQQSSSLVTLPVILLSYAVVARVTSTPGSPALLIGAVAWVVAILLSIRGAGKLKRESLLGVAAET